MKRLRHHANALCFLAVAAPALACAGAALGVVVAAAFAYEVGRGCPDASIDGAVGE